MKAWWRRVRPYVLAAPIYWVARLIGMSLKLKVEGYEAIEALPGAKIMAGWHGRTFIAATFFRNKGIWTIISQSRDGEMQNRIFTRFGFNTIRGSTGRGGMKALVDCIRLLKEGKSMAFTPDGPRGPTHIVQEGIIFMASKSGAALVPCGVSARKRWVVKTWDSYMVPKPFSEAIMIFGEPIWLDRKAAPEEFERVRKLFEDNMNDLENEAERRMGHSG
ncbi:MAG: lysophospholipid acyltransferase family protein [Armatimonadetes bacterium]|nr:lysophospholipid acyltransferase family protein [Armatimonadota bacterium]